MSTWSPRNTGKDEQNRVLDSLRKSLPVIEKFEEDLWNLDLTMEKEVFEEIIKKLLEEKENDYSRTPSGCFSIFSEILEAQIKKVLLNLEQQAKAEHAMIFPAGVAKKITKPYRRAL